MSDLQLWLRPWAGIGVEGRDYRILHPGMPAILQGHAEPIGLCTAAPGGPLIDGRPGGCKETHSLADGRRVYTMPIPLRASAGMTLGAGAVSVRLFFDGIPDRPTDGVEPTTERQREAIALLDRVKSVWARLREVESAIADPATIWTELTRLWLADDTAATPEMDVIVRQARMMLPILDLLDRAPRRILRRTQQMIPLARVQEIDRRAMIWLVRQPGETMAERAGDRQRISAVAREENFDTLENRVLRSYARLASAVARDYGAKHRTAMGHGRVLRVAKLGKRCRQLDADLLARGVGEAGPGVTPNFVLQNNANYRMVWDSWDELLKRGRILDDLWRWQARSWEEFCALALVVALQSIPGARLIATSPLVFREEQEQGRWLRHVNPLAVFFLPEQEVTVEVRYGPPSRPVLRKFGAPLWLRFGRVGDNTFLSWWAVWPIWHAKGGLDREDMAAIAPLLNAGEIDTVRGGLTIRPVTAGGDAQSEQSEKSAGVTIGAAGTALGAGITLLRDLLMRIVLRGAA